MALQKEGFLVCSIDNICGTDDKYKLFYESEDGVTYVEFGNNIRLFSFYEDGNYFYVDKQINVDSKIFIGKYILKDREYDGKFVDKINQEEKKVLQSHINFMKKIIKILES